MLITVQKSGDWDRFVEFVMREVRSTSCPQAIDPGGPQMTGALGRHL